MQEKDNYNEMHNELKKQFMNNFLLFLMKAGVNILQEDIDSISISANNNIDELVKFKNKENTFFDSIEVNLSQSLINKLFKIDQTIKGINLWKVSTTINRQLDILEMTLVIIMGSYDFSKKSKNGYLRITFDTSLNMNHLAFVGASNNSDYIIKTTNFMSLDNEIFLFKFLYIIEDSIINQIMPEIRMVGVYDYNSEEFKRRIEYCELLEY